MTRPDKVPPHLLAILDQAKAQVRDMKDTEPGYCAPVPAGCGKKIEPGEFRDQASTREYQITHLCQSCQDVLFAPCDDEVAEMAADSDRFGRCVVCGEYRAWDYVDIGVGEIRGFTCCVATLPFDQWPPRCTKTPDCALCEGHAHDCTNREDFHS